MTTHRATTNRTANRTATAFAAVAQAADLAAARPHDPQVLAVFQAVLDKLIHEITAAAGPARPALSVIPGGRP